MKPIKETNGTYSSLRILLFLAFGLMIWMFLEWRWAFRLEAIKEEPNYEGLTKLFIAMMVTFALGLFAKVWQKKYEKGGDDEKG